MVPSTWSSLVIIHGTVIPPEWFAFVNTWIERSIEGTAGCDGSLGEEYQPVHPIRINGGGIATGTTLRIEETGSLIFDTGTFFTVDAGATVDLQGDVTIGGSLGVGADVGIGGDTDISADLTVGGNAAVVGNASIDGLASLNGGATVPTGQTLTLDAGSIGTLAGAVTADDVTMSGTNRVKLASRLISRVAVAFPTYVGAGVDVDLDGIVTSTSVAGTEYVCWPIDPPDGSTVDSVSIVIAPAGGHGIPPTPTVELCYRTSASTGAATVVSAASDTSPDATTYETAHPITITAVGHVVIRGDRSYFIRFQFESGMGAIVGCLAAAPSYSCAVTSYPEC